MTPSGAALAARGADWSRAVVSARASEHALWGFGALCFAGYLTAQFVSLTRLYLIEHLGGVAAWVASQAGLLSVGLLVPAVVAYGLRSGSLFGVSPRAHACGPAPCCSSRASRSPTAGPGRATRPRRCCTTWRPTW